MIQSLLLLICFLSNSFANSSESATEKITITADRVPRSIKDSTHSTEVIQLSPQDRSKSVYKILEQVVGLAVFNQGGLGKVSQVFMRGTNSEHVLFLLDGVPLNDSMSPTRSFDLSNIDLSSIDRIEIVKGPQSVAYGSDAIGGIIHLISKRPPQHSQTRVQSVLGTDGFISNQMSFNQSLGKTSSKFTLSRKHANGISSANSEDGNAERDGFQHDALNIRVGRVINERNEIDFMVKAAKIAGDVDRGGGRDKDDPNFVFSRDQNTAKVQWNSDLSDSFSTQVSLAKSITKRASKNDIDQFSSSTVDDYFLGETNKIDWQNSFLISEKSSLVAGIESKHELGHSTDFKSQSAVTNAVFVLGTFDTDDMHFAIGIRDDQHSQSKRHQSTLRASVGVDITANMTIRAASGTGFKTPSLYQIYDPTYGNKELLPEEVLSSEVSLQWQSSTNTLSVTAFDNDFSNLISNDPVTFKSINLGESRISGVESSLKTTPIHFFTLGLGYTQLIRFLNESKNEVLLRRPRHLWLASLEFQISDKSNLSLKMKHMGERRDIQAETFNTVDMPSHETVDLTYSYQQKSNINYFLRVENLMDKKYELIDGYGTPRLSGFFGFHASL